MLILEKNAEENDFFKEVLNSMKNFAKKVVPYWSNLTLTSSKYGQASYK